MTHQMQKVTNRFFGERMVDLCREKSEVVCNGSKLVDAEDHLVLR